MKKFISGVAVIVGMSLGFSVSSWALDFMRILHTFNQETGEGLAAKGVATFKNIEGTDSRDVRFGTGNHGFTVVGFSLDTSTPVVRHAISARSRSGLCTGYVEGYSVGLTSVTIEVPMDCNRAEPIEAEPVEPILP